MAHYGTAVEYGLHVLVTMAGMKDDQGISAKDIAEFQGAPPSYLAKTLSLLCKAGILESIEGHKGGYRLSRSPSEITFLDVVDAIEGSKNIFECTEVRLRCIVNRNIKPNPALTGICAIHAVMLEANKRMREALAANTIGDIANALDAKWPARLKASAERWLADRTRTHPR